MFKSIRNRLTACALVGLVAAGSGGRLEAAGFALFEQGSKANAVGGAFAATADDPSAMFFNPAGNAFVDRFTLEGGGFVILRPTAHLDGLSPYPGDGYSTNMRKTLYAIGHGYLVLPLSDSVKLSGGFWSPNGLGVPWANPETFAGRFLNQRVDLRQLAVSAQLAFKLSDWVAIGGGPEIRLTDVQLSRNISAVNPFTQRVVDIAHVSIVSEGTPIRVGLAAGILVKPCERLRLGISYHSHMDVDLEGPADFGQISTGNAQFDAAVRQSLPFHREVPARTSIQFPSVTMFGIAYDVTPNLTLEVDGNYTTWKVFDQTVLRIETLPDSVLTHGWENTWAVRAGLTYRMGSSWVAGGFIYDQTPQPDADVGPFLPDANRTGGTIGAGIAVSKHFEFQFSSLFLWFHERTITTSKDNFSAKYQTFAILPSITIKSTF
ncbi:MAG TPA: outer membrane protein transport protein [Thermoanaerobaculia bacterium]|nr:outer membrane protein transport protein [Thermoanaerobaculia bacterium]